MNQQEAISTLKFFFPRWFKPNTNELKSDDGQLLFQRLQDLETRPVNLTHLNQMLHLVHEAGITEGLFRYYFLTVPRTHPYPVDKVSDPLNLQSPLMPGLDETAVWSLRQLRWGLARLFIDGLLFWGDVRTGFRALRTQSFRDLVKHFAALRLPSTRMRRRGPPLDLQAIQDRDRYLISEIVCQAFEPEKEKKAPPLVEWLTEAFRKRGEGAIPLSSLLNLIFAKEPGKKALLALDTAKIKERTINNEQGIQALVQEMTNHFVGVEDLLIQAYKNRGNGPVPVANLITQALIADPTRGAALGIGVEEIKDQSVNSEDDISKLLAPILDRFQKARKCASENTRLYLSMVNEMDVYVATSMRSRSNFEEVAQTCRKIFEKEGLRRFWVRYFDPTRSVAGCPEDKGLIECLMVKCAKMSLYLAGEADSFGKDAEVAMTLSLGKPVVILCPNTPKGLEREKVFRDIHPLSRLIDFQTGVAVGAIVTHDSDQAAAIVERIFDNQMEYDLENDNGYLRLKERLTKSIVRVQTSNRLLRESFWNYYHGIQ